jgi:Flp pilus assembly pilin Flp
MQRFITAVRSFLEGEKGQTLTEYLLILILIAVVIFLMLTTIGTTVHNGYSTVNSMIKN